MRTKSSQRQPERETQVRPRVTVDKEKALLAWNRAVQQAAGRKITARLVKAALEAEQPEHPPQTRESRQSRTEKQKLIDTAIGELLVLLSQRASHAILTQKVEALYACFQALFPKPQKKGATP